MGFRQACHHGPNDKQYRNAVSVPREGTEILFPNEESKKGAIVPMYRTDFFKTSALFGEQAANRWRSARLMEWCQIRTKATYRANSKKVKRKQRCTVLQLYTEGHGVLSLEGSLSGAHTDNKTQHRNRVDLDITKSLN